MFSMRYYLPHVPEENYKRKEWAQSVFRKYVGGLIRFGFTVIFYLHSTYLDKTGSV